MMPEDLQLGKMSRDTYESIPKHKRPPLYPDGYFIVGDLVRPGITVQVTNDPTLARDTLFVSQGAKDIYYPEQDHIEVE